MLTVAVLAPVALGSKVTWKVVCPLAATGLVGWVVTVKSAALVPSITTLVVPVRFSAAEPVFLMVKVLTTVPPAISALPKSLWSVVAGVSSPSAISVLFPSTLISGGDTSHHEPEYPSVQSHVSFGQHCP